jgi:hypothetical protein
MPVDTPILIWTPRGSSTTKSVDFGSASCGLQRLKGFSDVNRKQSFTAGGKPFTVTHGVFNLYKVRVTPLGPYRSAAHRAIWSWLTSWWSHASVGGTFTFSRNSTKLTSALTLASVAETATSISCTSTGFTADDWVWLEDAADPTKNCARQVASTTTGSVAVADAVGSAFVTSSVIRHLDYFASCVCLDDEAPFNERDAGKGANLWDLEFIFRTAK